MTVSSRHDRVEYNCTIRRLVPEQYTRVLTRFICKTNLNSYVVIISEIRYDSETIGRRFGSVRGFSNTEKSFTELQRAPTCIQFFPILSRLSIITITVVNTIVAQITDSYCNNNNIFCSLKMHGRTPAARGYDSFEWRARSRHVACREQKTFVGAAATTETVTLLIFTFFFRPPLFLGVSADSGA